MGYTLIISEKPTAASRIADALSGGEAEKLENEGAPYYRLKRGGKVIVVAPAVGHLFVLSEADKKAKWTYPIFDVKWIPTIEEKNNKWATKYFMNMEKLASGASEVIAACDFDTEGSVIGYNIIRFLCKKEDGKRMKFSTLTPGDLIEAYEKASPRLDFPQIEAGLARHHMDWLFGINLSRALTLALEHSGGYWVLSTGRVQGPTLKLLEDRQREIERFKPVPYWELNLHAVVDGKSLLAGHARDKFWKKPEADSILSKCKGRDGVVRDVEKKQVKAKPPVPFDLTSLQREAYSRFGYSPKQTLDYAQHLYEHALISYPRTSSQKLPEKLGFRDILKKLSSQLEYGELAEKLLARPALKPNEGKKSDPAHPAIFPTGHKPRKLASYQRKVYDMIVRRFFAVFGDAALREQTRVVIDIQGEEFVAHGVRTLKANWMEFYKPYLSIKEQVLPEINKGDPARNRKLEMLDKETEPPNRYSQASILKEMEENGLGTKCLTGDCSIITPEWKEVRLDGLWKGSKHLCYDDGVEVRRLNTPTAVSLNHDSGSVEFKKPQLISRRMVKENERLLRIAVNGGELKATEDHPIYVYNKDISLKKAKDISKGDNIVSIISRNKTGRILVGEEFFLKNDFKLYKGMYVHKFSSRNSLGIRRDKLPLRWSSDLAWLLGYFYGDGSYNLPCYNGSHQVFFTVGDDKYAVDILKARIKRVFGVEPKAYKVKGGTQYKVQCNSAMARVLAEFFPSINGKKRFRVPKGFTGDFLRGFFDSDGNVHPRGIGKLLIRGNECVGHGVPRVKITLSRREHIEWVRDLLSSIGIKSNIKKGKARLQGKEFDYFTILIGGRDRLDRFAHKVGFDLKHKKRILYRGLLSDSPKYKILRNCYDTVVALKGRALDANQIRDITNRNAYETRKALKYLVRLGILERKRLSPFSNPPNRAVYRILDKDYLIHALMARSRHINGEMFSSKVIKIEDVKPANQFVYDISVSEDSPNFITNSGLLVHNSTRAGILQTLYDRAYVKERSIVVTELGESVVKALEKHSPEIVSVDLTKQFEEDMESIEAGKLKREDVIRSAEKELGRILEDFKEHEKEIGGHILEAVRNYEKEIHTVGTCDKCRKGELRIIHSRRTGKRFVGCSGYPDCHNSFPLPQHGFVQAVPTLCKCGLHLIEVRPGGRRPWRFCVRHGFEYRDTQKGASKKDFSKGAGKKARKPASKARKTSK